MSLAASQTSRSIFRRRSHPPFVAIVPRRRRHSHQSRNWCRARHCPRRCLGCHQGPLAPCFPTRRRHPYPRCRCRCRGLRCQHPRSRARRRLPYHRRRPRWRCPCRGLLPRALVRRSEGPAAARHAGTQTEPEEQLTNRCRLHGVDGQQYVIRYRRHRIFASFETGGPADRDFQIMPLRLADTPSSRPSPQRRDADRVGAVAAGGRSTHRQRLPFGARFCQAKKYSRA